MSAVPALDAEDGDLLVDPPELVALRDCAPGPGSAALLAGLSLADLSSADLVDAVTAAERLVAWAQAVSLQAVAELDRRFDPPDPPDSAVPHQER